MKRRFKGLFYSLGELGEAEMLKREFNLALRRKVAQRIERGFIKTYKPIMDDAPYRIFQTMRDYRRWCEKKLSKWLGYGKGEQGFYK